MAQVASLERVRTLLEEAANRGARSVWIENGTLALGDYPQPKHRLCFNREELDTVSAGKGDLALSSRSPARPARVGGRSSGEFELEVRGRPYKVHSLKQVLAEGLIAVEAVRPGTLEALSRERARSKRVVAKKRDDLYENSELQRFSVEIAPGWFMATNNSEAETIKFLRKAVELAGLTWNVDVRYRRLR